MTRTIVFAWLLIASMTAWSQEAPAPKWVAKQQKAIVAIITYDKNNELLHEGTGAVISADGIVIADYALFKGACRAICVDQGGTQYNVERILGADESYNAIRFKVNAKKLATVPIATSTAGQPGTATYALGFTKAKVTICPAALIEKKDLVKESTVGGEDPDAPAYAYYTLNRAFPEQQTGQLLFDNEGKLLGIILSPIGNKSYAIDANFARNLSIKAIQTKSASLALSNVNIRRGLPETMEEALVYIYFQSRTANNDDYLDMLNLFIDTYPQNAEGYERRATPLTDLHRFDEADKDLQTYLRLAADKAQAAANVAQAIYTKLVYQPEPAYEKWNYDTAIGYIDQAIGTASQAVATAASDSARTVADALLLQYRLQKAQMLMGKKDERGALLIYDEVNAGPHRSAATFYAASMAHEAAGDSLDVCIALMDSAVACFTDPLPQEAANYIMRRGQLYNAAGQYRKAAADYDQYCYLYNNRVSASFYYDRSQIELKARLYQQALEDIDRAIKLQPQEPLYYVEKSAMQLRFNMIDECIASAEQCLRLDGNMPDAYRIMGYALLQKGEKDKARYNLEKAIELGDETAKTIIETYLK